MLKLGKTPARPGAVKLKFKAYFHTEDIPVPDVIRPPKIYEWLMLANDRVGDCVMAGAAHETMLFSSEVGNSVPVFDNASVLSDYSAITGYDPKDPNSDQGTNMADAAKYRQKTGIVDSSGVRHTVDVYADIANADLKSLALATYLFGAVGVGVRVTQKDMDQFEAAEPWSSLGGDVLGGHYIPCVGRNSHGNFLFVTWGRLHAATPEWVANRMDEGIAYISRERLTTKGLSPEGYSETQLIHDLQQVTA